MDFGGLLLILFFDIALSGAVGGLIAFCMARIQQRHGVGWWKTAVLSALGFLIGVYGANFVGFYWTSFTDADKYYGHPDYDGFGIAILVSVIFELYRYGKAQSAKSRP